MIVIKKKHLTIIIINEFVNKIFNLKKIYKLNNKIKFIFKTYITIYIICFFYFCFIII